MVVKDRDVQQFSVEGVGEGTRVLGDGNRKRREEELKDSHL